jgi:Methyltransferase domain
MELLIGCGSQRNKLLNNPDRPDWTELVTLDINERHKPDVVHDLNQMPWPFADGIFDEVHGYEVMEHLGKQGDYRSFFDNWSEIWRILKPDGVFVGSSPDEKSTWLWGDPGHTRVISPASLTFLSQEQYDIQVGNTPMTDYRFCYKADFEPAFFDVKGDTFVYVMRAIKPSRYQNGQES